MVEDGFRRSRTVEVYPAAERGHWHSWLTCETFLGVKRGERNLRHLRESRRPIVAGLLLCQACASSRTMIADLFDSTFECKALSLSHKRPLKPGCKYPEIISIILIFSRWSVQKFTANRSGSCTSSGEMVGDVQRGKPHHVISVTFE